MTSVALAVRLRTNDWIFSLYDLIGDSATQHVAGDVPSEGIERQLD